jgi:hypothetical protein
MRNISLLAISLIIATSASAKAQLSSRSPTETATVAASTFLHDPNMYKLSYVTLIRTAAQNEVKKIRSSRIIQIYPKFILIHK